MERRKIQLIAGTTYSISLPKDWIKKNILKEKNELYIHEKNDRTLVISPNLVEEKRLSDISLNVDDYILNIDQILFALYYLGIENISLFSKNRLTKDVKAKIRKTLTHMSGTEISYEDEERIVIKGLLDSSKIDITQLIYRISLIIELSVTNILERLDINEIKINENEIDRLYHLIAKIISLSLIDSKILHSSKIKNISLVPPYFLISKKLENIGDNINHLSDYLQKNRDNFEHKKEILHFIKNEIHRSIRNIINNFSEDFQKADSEKLKAIYGHIYKIKDNTILDYLEDVIRFIIDIEEEIVNISFYNKLIKENSL